MPMGKGLDEDDTQRMRKKGGWQSEATLNAQTYCQRTPVSKRRRGFAEIRSSVGVYLRDQPVLAAGSTMIFHLGSVRDS
jgi:hypothetical protein